MNARYLIPAVSSGDLALYPVLLSILDSSHCTPSRTEILRLSSGKRRKLLLRLVTMPFAELEISSGILNLRYLVSQNQGIKSLVALDDDVDVF